LIYFYLTSLTHSLTYLNTRLARHHPAHSLVINFNSLIQILLCVFTNWMSFMDFQTVAVSLMHFAGRIHIGSSDGIQKQHKNKWRAGCRHRWINTLKCICMCINFHYSAHYVCRERDNIIIFIIYSSTNSFGMILLSLPIPYRWLSDDDDNAGYHKVTTKQFELNKCESITTTSGLIDFIHKFSFFWPMLLLLFHARTHTTNIPCTHKFQLLWRTFFLCGKIFFWQIFLSHFWLIWN
jgi:hypothetical protein